MLGLESRVFLLIAPATDLTRCSKNDQLSAPQRIPECLVFRLKKNERLIR